MNPKPEHHRVVIIGAGFSGLGMAIRLQQRGMPDFVVLERAGDVGGTWRANTYPGCQCDVPSHLYSFSFAPNPDWSRTYSPQPEIWDYLRDCARRFDILPHCRFGHEVTEARWDAAAGRWQVETAGGAFTADVLVAAMGILTEPVTPSIPGIDTFAGTLFHSTHWDHGHNLDGERVAVIGTGASAIQLVPEIQPRVRRLSVFQRTAPWILPHLGREVRPWAHRIYRAAPVVQQLMRAWIYWTRELFVLPFLKPKPGSTPERVARHHLAAQVADSELRRRLTPDYQIGCKRILISNDYYPALQQSNAELVTDAIVEIRSHSVVTADGAEREVDTIILGTGFRVTETPFASRIRGRDGRLLAQVWDGSPEAYRGTTVAGFPNLFLLLGPNTGLGHTSVVLMIEAQIGYVLDAIRLIRREGGVLIEVRPQAQVAFNAEIQARLGPTVWNTGGCRSWYLDRNGRNSTLWPGDTRRFVRLMRRFDPAAYSIVKQPQPGA